MRQSTDWTPWAPGLSPRRWESLFCGIDLCRYPEIQDGYDDDGQRQVY